MDSTSSTPARARRAGIGVAIRRPILAEIARQNLRGDYEAPSVYRLDASSPTEMLRELFDYEVESEDFDTVGGFLIHELGRLPSAGDEVTVGPITMRVLSMAGRRIRRMRITRVGGEPPEEVATR